MDEKTWLYWQRRLVEAERRIEKLEAQQNAYMVENVGDYLTVDQMARALDVKPITIRRRIKSGAIRAQKIGKTWRIPRNELTEIFE